MRMRAFRLGLLLALGSWAGCSDTPDSPAVAAAARGALVEEADELPGGARVADEVRPAAAPARELDRALQARLRATISKWIAEAARRSDGKATSGNVRVAVHVRESGVRGELVSIGATRPQAPASNMKLVTSAAALGVLGADWSFRTRFATDAELADGRLRGDLVVVASGDPLYGRDEGGSVSGWLRPVARKLHESGVRVIEGDLVLDERGFADPAPAEGWPGASQSWQEYCALSAGFTANAGCLTVTLRPGAVGGAAQLTLEPRDHGLPEQLDVRTGARRTALNVVVEGNRGKALVRGSLPADVPEWQKRFAVADPVELFANTLVGTLRDEGITLLGEVVRERGRGARATRELCVLESPLTEVLVPVNTDSNNPVADQVLKALGQEVSGEGSFAGGARAVRLALLRLGVSTDGFVQADGSGLSRDNRVSAAQLTALIEAVLALGAEPAAAFRRSLAVGGETGTLKDRMRGELTRGRVFAKTGWISGVSALSGILRDGRDRELVFSILVEYPRVSGLNKQCWKPMHDELCETLCGFDG